MKRTKTRAKRSPRLAELQRRQLDQRLKRLAPVQVPTDGWIRAIRESLGMTMAQLGRRLGISPQSVLALEERERSGAISVAKLQAAAKALDCDLQITFAPRTSLQDTVRRQAAMKARAERKRLIHTMRLEAQEEGVAGVINEKRALEAWLTTRMRRLWD